MKRFNLPILIIILIGALFRLDLLIAQNFRIDADEAIVGLMAKHIIEGRGVPVFYYGQDYMGSFEAILTAVAFLYFGISNFSLNAIPFIFSLIFIYQIYKFTSENFSELSGRIAAICTAICPVALLSWSTKARGGFIELLVIGLWALILMVRWRKNPGLHNDLYLACFLLGFGWWTNNQIIYFMAPAIWLFISFFREISISKFIFTAFCGAATFLLGGLPYWLYNIANNFPSFGMFSRANFSEFIAHLGGVFSTSIPILIGAKRFWQEADYFPYSSLIAYIIWGIPILILLIPNWRSLLEILKFDSRDNAAYKVSLILIVACVLVFSSSSFGYLTQAPRYLLPVYAGLLPLIGVSLERLYPLARRLYVIAILVLSLLSYLYGGRAVPGEPFVNDGDRVSKDHTELLKFLNKEGISHVRTNYWIGYRLAFESKEAVTFSVFQKPKQVRIPEYEVSKEIESLTPLVLVPSQLKLVKSGLKSSGISFKKKQLSNYSLLYDLTRKRKTLTHRIPIQEISASNKSEMINLVQDGDRQSRWGSGAPQHPDMWIVFSIPKENSLRAIKIFLGSWKTDFPRCLKVFSVTDSGEEELLLNNSQYKGLLYVSEDDSYLEMYLEENNANKFKLSQCGSDPVFDWSIAELEVYE